MKSTFGLPAADRVAEQVKAIAKLMALFRDRFRFFIGFALKGSEIVVVLFCVTLPRMLMGAFRWRGQGFFRPLAAWLPILDLMNMRLVESRICDAKTTFREIL